MASRAAVYDEPSLGKKILKWSGILLGALFLLVLLAFLVIFRTALYHHFVSFPREETAWKKIRTELAAVPYKAEGYQEYRGVCHSHSLLSHDSEVPWEHIVKTMKETGRQFICMSDHCQDGPESYSLQWRGIHDGVLIIPGFEMSHNLMPWGIPPNESLECGDEELVTSKKVADLGGVLCIAHPEGKKDWSNPYINAMEIYNIHADLLAGTKGGAGKFILKFAPDALLNLGSYPDLTMRLNYNRNTEVLKKWDELNISRNISGVTGNDCHQNVGIYGVWKPDGKLEVRSSSGEPMKKVNPALMALFKMISKPFNPGTEAFRFQLDPYERSTRFVATHVYAKELTEPAILDAIKQGRGFVSFDMIADANGFLLLAKSQGKQYIFGDKVPMSADATIIAASPHTGRFTLLRHGIQVAQQEGASIEYKPTEPGKYRVEVELNVCGQWVPWIYSNPIEVTTKPV